MPAVRGKVEFDALEEGREEEVLTHLMKRSTAETFRARLSGLDLSGLQKCVEEGGPVETGELVPGSALLASLGTIPGLASILSRLDGEGSESPALAASAVEFAMEGLHLHRRLAKEELPGRTVYG